MHNNYDDNNIICSPPGLIQPFPIRLNIQSADFFNWNHSLYADTLLKLRGLHWQQVRPNIYFAPRESDSSVCVCVCVCVCWGGERFISICGGSQVSLRRPEAAGDVWQGPQWNMKYAAGSPGLVGPLSDVAAKQAPTIQEGC